MNDTTRDLQRLIDDSVDAAGPFLRSSFDMPECTLNAAQLVHRLSGSVTLALGTVTSDGRPRVAPVIALFYSGELYIPTVRTALRTRHVLNNPNISLSVYEGNDFAIIVHGRGSVIGADHDLFEELVSRQIEVKAGDVRTWGDPVFIHVVAERLYSFARFPDQFPES